MKTKVRFTHIVFALLLASSILGISNSMVLAAPPTHGDPYTVSAGFEQPGICSFPLHLDIVITSTDTFFTDSKGTVVRIFTHSVQHDTFSANSKTLVGLPYTYNVEVHLDSSGNAALVTATGIVEKVPLPDGRLFISAGWLDFTSHFPFYVISSDRGNPGDLAAFCAALS